MNKYDLIIKNGNVVLRSGVKKTSIAIKAGVICEIGDQLAFSSAEKVWDAEGDYVFPGMIDVHVHFNEPGREYWEGFETGSYMLAAGGGTTFFDMPLNGIPSTVDIAALFDKAKIATEKSVVDFGLWGGLVPGNVDKLAGLASEGVIGFKAFMSPSGNEEFEAVDDVTLLKGMKEIARLNKILALHAENGPIVDWLADEKQAQGLVSSDDYVDSRPIIAEVEAVQHAISYSELTGCALHFVHISSAAAVEKIIAAKKKGLDITLETCPHYLLFNRDDFRRLGPVAKCAPPLRDIEEQQKLIELLIKDEIDMVTSDHSPSSWDLKETADGNMFKAWGGISGGEFTLMALIELALQYNIPLEKIAQWTATAPAERFKLHPKKGEISIGSDADFAIVSLKESHLVTNENLHSKHKQSLYVNHEFPCRIIATFNRGSLVYEYGLEKVAAPSGTWQKGSIEQKI